MDLNKKRIVITGGGSGIGLAMARSLASLGSHVVITPGQSAQLKLMSRLAPGFLFKQMNKNAKR